MDYRVTISMLVNIDGRTVNRLKRKVAEKYSISVDDVKPIDIINEAHDEDIIEFNPRCISMMIEDAWER